MRFFLFLVLIFFGFIETVNSQTNINGVISHDTSLTLLNSPYFVTDSLVLDSGVTLVIEPGVTIQFNDSTFFRVRGILKSLGTISDSITFTFDTASSNQGNWGGISFKPGSRGYFNYCNINNYNIGISAFSDSINVKNTILTKGNIGILTNNGTVCIDSCILSKNNTGFKGSCKITNCIFQNDTIGLFTHYFTLNRGYISNCTIINCQTGILSGGHMTIKNCIIKNCNGKGIERWSNMSTPLDTIINNEIKYNYFGVYDFGSPAAVYKNNAIEFNNIGFRLEGTHNAISCNKICNNLTYDFYNNVPVDINLSNNYWCLNDSSTIADHIYDWYDNHSSGRVIFFPFDTSQCNFITNIDVTKIQKIEVNVYPNPATDFLIIQLPVINNAQIKIFNMIGQLMLNRKAESSNQKLNISDIERGLYFIEIIYDNKNIRSRFIKQ
ncbi:MAG TPA: hypothetical protein DEH02_03520 [Bacteroidales bacterium]|nr:MAG: hypothetical protein A2X01_14820 [Bacteroidetes bacterium GWF2_35_48]HBX50120.1 hypothetical protein [Bacteroidales bacterium]